MLQGFPPTTTVRRGWAVITCFSGGCTWAALAQFRPHMASNHQAIYPMRYKQVFHPLVGESLTTGTVATVTWAKAGGLEQVEGAAAEGVELWLVKAPGGRRSSKLIAKGIDTGCTVSCTTAFFRDMDLSVADRSAHNIFTMSCQT